MSFTDEQKKEIAALIAASTKTALEEQQKAQQKAQQAALAAAITDAVKAASAPLNDKITEFEKKVGETKPPDGAAKPKPGEGATVPPELEARLRTLTDELATEKKARVDAERSAARQQGEQALSASLAAAGIPADRHPHALAYLERSGRFGQDKDGKVFILGKPDPVLGKPTVIHLDNTEAFADAAKSWGGSDEAAFYRPPTGQQGTGDRPTVSPVRGEGGKADWSAIGRAVTPRAVGGASDQR